MKIAIVGAYPIYIFAKQLGIDNPPQNTTSWNYNLANGLAALPDTEVHFITIDAAIKKDKIIEADKVIIHFLSSLRKIRFLTFYQYHKFKILRELKKINPDIVHGHGTEHEYPYIAVSSEFPSIITIHCAVKDMLNNVKFSLNQKFKLKFALFFERYVLNKTKGIIVTSPYLKNYYSKKVSKDIQIIGNSIDNIFISNSKINLNVNKYNWIYVGRISQEKGLPLLFNAIKKLHNDSLPIKLNIIGSVQNIKYYKELIQILKNNNLEEHIHFIGVKSQDEIVKLLRNSYGLILPSNYEAFGLVLAEAMALGVPAIASNVGGIPFVIENEKTGLLFEKGNISDLKLKIKMLIENEEYRRKLAENSIERAKERFSSKQIAQLHMNVYRRILEN